MTTEWQELRRDFPALEGRVYLNTAAAGLPPRPVAEAVTRFYRELEHDGDIHWEEWLARQELIRARVAHFVGAQPDEIAFVANTSTGINLIADLLAENGPVLSDELEFPTVTIPWLHRGVAVDFVSPVEGVLEPESFSEERAPGAATIVISHVQFSNGCRQDLAAFGALKGGRSLVVCGSQSTGTFPIDVTTARVDAFATAGHKWLCAGYGAGFVYVSRRLLEQRPPRAIGWLSCEDPYAFDNRRFKILPSARRVEMGCPAFAGAFALGAAVEYLAGIGIERIAERVLELNTLLTTRLLDADFTVLSPGGAHRSGQTLCRLPEPARAKAFLEERGVLVTEKAEGVRLATHFYNSEEEIETAVRALEDYRRALAEG